MLDLIDKSTERRGRTQIPEEVQTHVPILKDLCSRFSDSEIACIIQNTLGHRIDKEGIRRIIDSKALPEAYQRSDYLQYPSENIARQASSSNVLGFCLW